METKHLLLLTTLAILPSGCIFGPPYRDPIEYLPPGWNHPALNEAPNRAGFIALRPEVIHYPEYGAGLGQPLHPNCCRRALDAQVAALAR